MEAVGPTGMGIGAQNWLGGPARVGGSGGLESLFYQALPPLSTGSPLKWSQSPTADPTSQPCSQRPA